MVAPRQLVAREASGYATGNSLHERQCKRLVGVLQKTLPLVACFVRIQRRFKIQAVASSGCMRGIRAVDKTVAVGVCGRKVQPVGKKTGVYLIEMG